MSTRKNLVSSLLAIGLVLGLSGSASSATGQHSHDGHDAGSVELTLDAGKKWSGDDSLRKAMAEIRVSVASQLVEIHENRLPAKEYKALAKSVQEQVDYMVENCDLPVAEDEQLHIVLNQIIEGIYEMEEGTLPWNGAVKIIQATTPMESTSCTRDGSRSANNASTPLSSQQRKFETADSKVSHSSRTADFA